MKKILLLTAMVLFLVFGFFSCSNAEPRILYGYIGLTYYPGNLVPYERYTFFIHPDDDDGIENLSELYLYNDREGLKWLLTSEDWISYENEGKTWIGSRHIAMHDDANLPRGVYRAVLINKNGERAESKFTFDGPYDSPYPYPVLSLRENICSFSSQYPVNNFIFYDHEGNFIGTAMNVKPEMSLDDFQFESEINSVALWAEDRDYHISAVTEPIPVN